MAAVAAAATRWYKGMAGGGSLNYMEEMREGMWLHKGMLDTEIAY